MDPKFAKYEVDMAAHQDKHTEDYKNAGEKAEHKAAQKQLLMGDMPPFLVPSYNELVIMLGWVLFYSTAFPMGSFFCIFASFMTVYIELETMALYKKKNKPQSVLDVGVWIEYLETVSLIGVFVTTYLVIFTSSKLDGVIPSLGHHELIILAFCVQHVILLLKIILAEVIDDEPAWVQDDMDVVDNRVDQMAQKIEDMKFMERLSEHYKPLELIGDVFDCLHRDHEIAALLIPKLKAGCK